MKKVKRSAKRNWIQLASAVFFNGYALGYQWGHIFTGKSKMFCVPILNCYSCPGALGACPIGSLQSLAGGRKFRLSFYVLGMLMLFGLFLGRAVMRFFMSLRVASGSSVPDPLPKDHDFCKTGPLAPLYKICGTCSVCVPVAGPASESVRDGNHLVLQIHMPCRYTGRRNPAPADQRRSAAGSRSPVSMEIYRIGDRYGSFCPDLSSLLQISVPPWSFLRSLQPIQSVSTDP